MHAPEYKRGDQKLGFEVEVIERDDDPQRFADLVNPEENVVARLGILGIEISQKIAQMLPDLRKKYGLTVENTVEKIKAELAEIAPAERRTDFAVA